MVKIKKDDNPIIYKQDLIDSNGKLNFVGTLMIVGITLACLNKVFEYFNDCLVDKDKVC